VLPCVVFVVRVRSVRLAYVYVACAATYRGVGSSALALDARPNLELSESVLILLISTWRFREALYRRSEFQDQVSCTKGAAGGLSQFAAL
jgi:hypothetical protein